MRAPPIIATRRGLAPTNMVSAPQCVCCGLWTNPPAYNLPMTRFSHGILLGLALSMLAGCGGAPAPAPAKAAKSAAPSEQLGRIVERYWAERLVTDDAISPQLLADSLSIERRYLAEVLGVPRDGLDFNSRLTYDIFRRQRQVAIEGFTFPAELFPINPFRGMPLELAAAAADTGQRPLSTAAEYE